jgi:signal transduction histidine kinase
MSPSIPDSVAFNALLDELVRTRERYQSFVANSSEAIWRFELDEPIDTSLPEEEQIDLAFARGFLGECNDAMARMYGLDAAEQIVGARLPDMLDPAQEKNRQFIRAFIRGGYRLTEAESIEVDRFGNRKYFVNSFIGVVEASLVDDLLDVSRIVIGKFRLALAAVDVVPVVRDVVASSRPAAEAKRVDITLNAPESIVIRADPNRLQQIVWNLVSNAVKFCLPDGHVTVDVEAGDDRVVIRVRDNGIGIAPDVLPRVFDRFWQADSAPDRVHSGLGLGLAIVKQIAELHGGSASAESAGPGRGAAFTITLPMLASPRTNPVPPVLIGL